MPKPSNKSTPPPTPIRVALVDDNKFYCRCLEEALGGNESIAWVGSFRNGVRFLTQLPELELDVVLMDIEMPRLAGVDCIAEIKAEKPAVKVLMISVHETDDYLRRAFLNGADGYLLKNSSPQEILQAIDAIRRGGASMSPSISRKLLTLFTQSSTSPHETSGKPSRLDMRLSPRENVILQELAQGKRYDEIAQALFISKDTVKSHLRKIYEKLGVRNRTEAIASFIKDKRNNDV